MSRQVKQLLEEAIQTHIEKSAEYGSTYKRFGPAMAAIFPNGYACCTEEQWTKMGVLFMLVHKVLRIAATDFESVDSCKDMIVYSAILEELCQEGQEQKKEK